MPRKLGLLDIYLSREGDDRLTRLHCRGCNSNRSFAEKRLTIDCAFGCEYQIGRCNLLFEIAVFEDQQTAGCYLSAEECEKANCKSARSAAAGILRKTL